MKRSDRGAVFVVGVALVVLSACSVDRSLAAPDCFTGESGLIVAQSVPGAEHVPCLESLPTGWDVDSVTIDQDGTVVRLDSDRAGTEAAVLHYTRNCDVRHAVSVPSDQDGADAFEYIEQLSPSFRGERYYTFEGGCVWWRFEFDEGTSAALSIELGNSLMFVSRSDLNQSIRENFIDEEL